MTPSVDVEAIPDELKALPRWVLWRYEPSKKDPTKIDKIPYSVSGKWASTSNPETWTTFQKAQEVFEYGDYSGLGYVFSGEDGLTGIDLDSCITNGKMAPEAEAIVNRFASYCEVSPSGTGVKLWVRGRVPCGRRTSKVSWTGDKPGIEVYTTKRYFCVTGHKWNVFDGIAANQDMLDRFYRRYFDEPTPPRAEDKPTSLIPDDLARWAVEQLQDDTQDRSGRDFAVLVKLIEAGCGRDAVQSLVSPYSKFSDPRSDYFARTWQNASKAASTNGERKPTFAYPEIVIASELGEDAPVAWLWDGYVAAGHSTLLTALWKCGKSTLLAHLAKACANGGQLGTQVKQAKVLIITEESRRIWSHRRDTLGIGDHVSFMLRPFKAKPSMGDWCRFAEETAKRVTEDGYNLICIDPITNVAPWKNENDSSEVMACLLPVNAWLEAGAGLLMLHHPRKGDGTEGQAARGSGALPGFVDVVAELRRLTPENREDARRVLTTFSRFSDSPAELVIELTPDGYLNCGTKADSHRGDRAKVLMALLERGPLSVDEIKNRWPDDGVPAPGKRTIGNDLRAAEALGWVIHTGAGTRGDPMRFDSAPFKKGCVPESNPKRWVCDSGKPPRSVPESNSRKNTDEELSFP